MDYNYVRMRNAVKENNYEKAEYYRSLYETGNTKTKTITTIDIVILILFVVLLLLGVYILYSETIQAELYPTLPVTTSSPLPVVGGVKTW